MVRRVVAARGHEGSNSITPKRRKRGALCVSAGDTMTEAINHNRASEEVNGVLAKTLEVDESPLTPTLLSLPLVKAPIYTSLFSMSITNWPAGT
jgi:hypothetical protein